MKETIAKALYYNFHNWTTSWEQQDIHIKLPFYGEAEAVIKALEADVPTSLMDYLLNDDEIELAIKEAYKPCSYKPISYMSIYPTLKAQLAKVAPYIEAQVKAERERVKQAVKSVFGGVIDEEIAGYLDKYVAGGE